VRFFVTTVALIVSVCATYADELPPVDVRYWRVPVAPNRLPPPEPVLLDECTVNRNSALYQQSLVYLSGLKVKSDQTSGWHPYITGICPGGEAESVGFREGDIIHAVTPIPVDASQKAFPWEVSTAENLEELLFKFRGKPVEMVVIRNGAQISLPSFVPRAAGTTRQPASTVKNTEAGLSP
jgi:hypothetical protein